MIYKKIKKKKTRKEMFMQFDFMDKNHFALKIDGDVLNNTQTSRKKKQKTNEKN